MDKLLPNMLGKVKINKNIISELEKQKIMIINGCNMLCMSTKSLVKYIHKGYKYRNNSNKLGTRPVGRCAPEGQEIIEI